MDGVVLVSKRVSLGPGTYRVGRFIGRLGVVSLPAVEAGLDLDQRVVRRHAAKLEAAAWLARAPWVWGEGSVVWLTALGIESARLCGIRPVKSPPSPTTIAHSVLVGWTAARVEHLGRVWRSSRELAVDRDRWAVRMRCERGVTEQLPDLAVWVKPSGPPVAVAAESGGRREDRQKHILEGWRDAVWTERYAGVYYDCASASVAVWIKRLAQKVHLAAPELIAAVQLGADEIASLSPAAADDEPALSHTHDTPRAEPAFDEAIDRTSARAPVSVAPAPLKQPEPPAVAEPETAEEAAERERRYREIFGIPEPKRRRPWRRSQPSWPGTT